MFRQMMKSKLHRATVTGANLHYVGSITLDPDLMEAADLLASEKVQIVNNNNGERFETYVIEGRRGSREVCLNGAAARLVQPGDTLIVISYAWMAEEAARRHEPRVVILGEGNRIEKVIGEEPSATVIEQL